MVICVWIKQMGLPQCLTIYHIHCSILLLCLLVVDSSNVNHEGGLKIKSPLVVDNGTNIGNDQKGEPNFSSNFVGVAHLEKEDGIESSKEVIQNDTLKGNISMPIKSSEDKNQEISESSLNLNLKDDEKEESGRIGVSGKDINEEMSGLLTGTKKGVLRDEECDPSYMCVDEKKNWTACLRIPGNDSPDLSLLIQNKGKGHVLVTITAPEFVELEESRVQLQEKEDKKVRVSIAQEGTDSRIVLTTEDSRCTIDFRELILQNSRVETRSAFSIRYLSITRIHCIIFLALTAFLLFGCGWIYFVLRTKFFLGNGYGPIKMELPVSGVAVKSSSETNDGWDNRWDDHWDDEEAPRTPTLPTTPNLSSRAKSLASRRLSKEGWKD